MSTENASRLATYTVAWICTLSMETIACIGMLDERHPFLPTTSADDTNSYTLGKIRGHNVVITSPSLGLLSRTTCARLISDTLRTFPEVTLCFSVGIGGGVWNHSHDIRLGDVVVLSPHVKERALIQLDISEDPRLHTQTTIPPLFSALVKAMLTLQSRHELEEPALCSYLAVLQDERAIFRPPNRQTDRLFRAGYDHEATVNDCSACDPNQIEHRPRRYDSHTPVIHFGKIASMHRVVKDGALRDQLAREFDIQCFEMDAAGLPPHIPCLVIRGISDYADSHKNTLWQGVAAATAAAYAKELLSVIPPERTNSASLHPSIMSFPGEQHSSSRFWLRFSHPTSPATKVDVSLLCTNLVFYTFPCPSTTDSYSNPSARLNHAGRLCRGALSILMIFTSSKRDQHT